MNTDKNKLFEEWNLETEAYLETLGQLQFESRQIRLARIEIDKKIVSLKKDFAKELEKHYKDFIQQKVIIEFRWKQDSVDYSQIVKGYLWRFELRRGELYPLLFGINKNGSRSAKNIPRIEIHPWYMIEKITIVK